MTDIARIVSVRSADLESAEGWRAPEGWDIVGIDYDRGSFARVYLVRAARVHVAQTGDVAEATGVRTKGLPQHTDAVGEDGCKVTVPE